MELHKLLAMICVVEPNECYFTLNKDFWVVSPRVVIIFFIFMIRLLSSLSIKILPFVKKKTKTVSIHLRLLESVPFSKTNSISMKKIISHSVKKNSFLGSLILTEALSDCIRFKENVFFSQFSRSPTSGRGIPPPHTPPFERQNRSQGGAVHRKFTTAVLWNPVENPECIIYFLSFCPK